MWKKLLSKFGRQPDPLPDLYPDLDDRALSQFLNEAEYRRVLGLPLIKILPPANSTDDPDLWHFAVGLSRVLIRNLLLLPDLSVRGREDSALLPRDVLDQDPDILNDTRCFVTGNVSRKDGFRVEYEFATLDRTGSVQVQNSDLNVFLRQSSEAIALEFGAKLNERLKNRWSYGQPDHPDELKTIGSIEFGGDDDDAVRELRRKNPKFVLPLHLISEDCEDKVPLYLAGMKNDPFDAQLNFLMFCAVWNSEGAERRSMQFIRKAIELSPAHGKAHMCAPHAAADGVDMIRHSELGYYLLPGNSFAVNNLILNMKKQGKEPKKILSLADEGIRTDPEDPSNYDRAIELCTELGDRSTALQYAQRLKQLYSSPMNPRTLYCLRQNPARAKMLDTGEYDPVKEIDARIDELRQNR